MKIILYVVLLLSTAALLQAKPAPNTLPPSIPDSLKAPSYAWAKQPWNTDEKPYIQARAEVENKARQTKNWAQLSRQLQNDFKQNSQNRVALYRWAYANNEAQKQIAGNVERRNFARPLLQQLRKSGLPSNYQTARLHFFLEARGHYPLALKSLGERLLKRNPTDDLVQFYYARILTHDYLTRSGRKRALDYATQFASAHPNDFKSYIVLAQAYSWQWLSGDDLSAVKKEIAAQRKYLQLRPDTPRSAGARKTMEEQIRVNQKYEAMIAKGEFKPDPILNKP